MEGMHAVGGILSKDKYQLCVILLLHYSLNV
jgi:hypothetical protein